MEDAEISDALKENFIASGINVHNNSKVISIEKLKTRIRINIENEKEQTSMNGSLAFVSSGSRRAISKT